MEISRPSLEERAAECARELTFSATVAYDGAPFAGFAKQPGQLTVQGELERALSLLFRRPVDVVCAGRTDAGVHARGQVVSFDIDACELRDRTPYNLRRSLNALTCEGIVVRAVEERPRGFSARFDAQWREYKYFLATGDTPPVFTDRTAWYVGRTWTSPPWNGAPRTSSASTTSRAFAWPLRPSASRPAAMWRRSPLPPRRFWASRTASSPCGKRLPPFHGAHHRGHACHGGPRPARPRLGRRGHSPPATAKPPAKTPPPAASSSGR